MWCVVTPSLRCILPRIPTVGGVSPGGAPEPVEGDQAERDVENYNGAIPCVREARGAVGRVSV